MGITESCLRKWMSRDAIDGGRTPGETTDEHRELIDARRCIRVLEMENVILERTSACFAGRTFSQDKVRLVQEIAADGIPVAVACRVLTM